MKIIIGMALALPIWANAQCSSSLFFSEYIEGTGNNKAIEIYNGTTGDIDLANYIIEIYFNGNTSPAHTKQLIGILKSAHVHVLALNNSSDVTLTGKANQTDAYSFSWFNGNDAIVLKEVNNDVIVDLIGEIGIDPGEAWVMGSGGTKDQTLVRKSHIISGNIDWGSGKNEWDNFPIDYFDNLGTHTFDCALPIGFTNVIVHEANSEIEIAWSFDQIYKGQFSILHSIDGNDFRVVGVDVNYNPGQEFSDYSFTHSNPSPGINYYQIVFHSDEGLSIYSPVINASSISTEINIFYNEADGCIWIQGTNNPVNEIYFSDALGRELLYQKLDGQTRIPLPTNNSTPIYFIKVRNNNYVKYLTVVK